MFHMYINGYVSYLPKGVDAIVSQGALGVSIFFALSGFLLTYSHLKDFVGGQIEGMSYYRHFIAKRIARIYPVYLIGLLFALIVSFGLDNIPSKLPLLTVLNATMVHSWMPSLAMQWYGGGSWSISTEMFFYLAFPVLLPLLVRVKKAKTLFVLLGIIIVLAAIPGLMLNYDRVESTDESMFVYVFPIFRISEFIAGVITGLLVLRFGWRVPVWTALSALAGAGIYLARFGFRLSGYVPHNLFFLPAIVALLGCLAHSPSSLVFRWLGSRLALYLGRISYSFYILQIVLLILAEDMWKNGTMPHSAWWIAPTFFMINIAAAVIVYEVVEKRMHKHFLSWLLPSIKNKPRTAVL